MLVCCFLNSASSTLTVLLSFMSATTRKFISLKTDADRKWKYKMRYKLLFYSYWTAKCWMRCCGFMNPHYRPYGYWIDEFFLDWLSSYSVKISSLEFLQAHYMKGKGVRVKVKRRCLPKGKEMLKNRKNKERERSATFQFPLKLQNWQLGFGLSLINNKMKRSQPNDFFPCSPIFINFAIWLPTKKYTAKRNWPASCCCSRWSELLNQWSHCLQPFENAFKLGGRVLDFFIERVRSCFNSNWRKLNDSSL